jgi:glyoxylase-like metal-dependent hydrolase (beta-lactamase superfamily II)
MLQRIREVTNKPIERVIISHYHADHIYGLQAFKDYADNPLVYAQRLALGYVEGSAASQGEDAERRLVQRREALFPWVDENTRIVPPDRTFNQELRFEVGGIAFLVRHLGPAHAPGDAVMLVEDFDVLFSGDVIYRGRVPFLDSPETDSEQWLEGLDFLTSLDPLPRFIIPGHGDASADPAQAVAATRAYIKFVRDAMRRAVDDFLSFDEAYRRTDWSRYRDLPAFDASNRGNALRIFLEMEAASF